ncbi:hypothetical protein PMIT1303_02260 [Prochlorococcus sp. MIT 1303]|nr:hypothetical protein PMIT1303_02260 [Prochlorococcus sp. MIT 1303]
MLYGRSLRAVSQNMTACNTARMEKPGDCYLYGDFSEL